jgi:hypothetical protein
MKKTDPIISTMLATQPIRRWLLIALAALSLVNILAGCASTSLQSDPVNVVEQYLQAKKSNDFSAWKATLLAAQKGGQKFTPSYEKPGDLGVLSLTVGKVAVSEAETERIKKMYSSSDLAKQNGWSDAFIAENMIAVSAEYMVDYDNTKVPYADGSVSQYFYLVRDDPSSAWLIWNANAPKSQG